MYTNNLLHSIRSSLHQAAFRPGHSTQTALIRLADNIRKAVGEYNLTILVLCNFSNAFDSIPHSLPLRKLRSINSSDRPIFHSSLE